MDKFLISRRSLMVLTAGLVSVMGIGKALAETTLEKARREGYIRLGFANEAPYGYGQAFLVTKGNPKAIKDYSSIAGGKNLKLAVMAGAVEGGYAKDAGIGAAQLVILPDQSSLVKAVQAGRADAAALTALSIADMASKNDGVESTQPFGTVAGKSVVGHGAIGFRKEDKDLYKAFNAELKKFIGSPEHIALVTPFGFGKGFLPTKTTEELCAGK